MDGILVEDKERLVSGKWLNCHLIEAAQALLSKAFPSIEGLQTPLNGERFKFGSSEHIQSNFEC